MTARTAAMAVLACALAPAGAAEPPASRAAPGYVADGACRACHPEIARSYREVGMARSFSRPRPREAIEDFEQGPFFHPASKRWYEIRPSGETYRFRRFQRDARGREVHVFETGVDWILGSGNHARTYLYRTPIGELYQLPLAWYSQEGRWGMAPGFDRPDHDGVSRRVRRECMFCHNGYPDVPAGSDRYTSPHTFPAELPEGTGCQRCHGPGGGHVRLASGGDAGEFLLRTSITNPGRLAPERRNDVCYQCHMQPSVAFPGTRRFGRGDYSFRAGDDLGEYLVHLDVVDAEYARDERFEINHHPYRLEQSRCFEASAGALSCLTCHDPHRKVPPAERAAHYRAACLSCHTVDACGLEAMAVGGADPQDCVACHMPPRRPQDVVEVVMTDHFIRRRPPGPELLAPLPERDPEIVDVTFHDPSRAPAGPLGELYRAATVVRSGGASAVDRLAALVRALAPEDIDPYLDLARGQLGQRRFADAEATLEVVLRRFPGEPRALEWLATAKAAPPEPGSEARQQAIALFRRALESEPERPELRHNLGLQLLATGAAAEAEAELEKAVALRPNMARAWLYLGHARVVGKRWDEALDAYRRTLAVDPGFERAYLALADLLVDLDRRDEAAEVLRHGVGVVHRPQPLQSALDGLQGRTAVRPSGPPRE